MKSTTASPVLFLVFTLFLLSCSTNDDELYHVFQNPPVEAKPFVRWWWNGNNVNKAELSRELKVLHEIGIGGVEINPIEMPSEAENVSGESLVWLSDEWNKTVKNTIEEAHDLNMIVDMIIGSGWPFGGKFLEKGEMIQGIGLKNFFIEGNGFFEKDIKEIMELPGRSGDRYTEAPPAEIFFATLLPLQLDGSDKLIDVTHYIKDGKIKFEIPDGKYQLIVGTWQEGFREVMHGAPGADGPVMDHYNKEAVMNYLNRFSDALNKALGGELGKFLRSLFCDSIELSGSNWTSDFFEQFKNRRGYDIKEYLPLIIYNPFIGYEDNIEFNEQFEDSVQRIRYDYNKTLVELYLERFVEPFHKWCNENGCLSRYQAYGHPWNIGISEGNMIPDIPESNNWLYSEGYYHGIYFWNKFAASGAHLMDRNIVSCEAMTETRFLFETSLEDIKKADDLNFITGINHSVLHGYNYSPPEAGFPGWIRFGTYFNEQNTWWPYLRYWTEYNARLSAVFQKSKAVTQVAILNPTADIWSEKGLVRMPLHITPWYGLELWRPLSQCGFACDYINETVIQESEKIDGKLKYNSALFETLILTDVKSIQPETAEAILDFVKNGGKLIIADNLPFRSPSLINAKENDSVVKQTFDQILEYKEQVKQITGPKERPELISWVENAMEQVGINPLIDVKSSNKDIYQVAYKYNSQKLFFFSNQNDSLSKTTDVSVKTKSSPWIWDAETGERYPIKMSELGDITLQLEPLQSVLLVFDNKKAGNTKSQEVNHAETMMLNNSWKMEFNHYAGQKYILDTVLFDLGKSTDTKYNTFSGEIVYSTSFNLENVNTAKLNIGIVNGVTEVKLNGINLGTKWWGKHTYDITKASKQGENILEIKYVSVLQNYAVSLTDNKVAQRWSRNKEKVSTGLTQPIKISYNN